MELYGIAYEAKKDYDNALENLSKTIEIAPNFSEGWYNLGNVFKIIKEYDKAIEHYNKATELNPEFAKAWFFMGCSYFDKKDYNKAINSLEKAIKLDPNLAQDVNPLLNDFKKTIDKLQESLTMSFINK